jgi:hypothetical protein
MVYTAQMAQRKGSIQGGKAASELTRVPDSHASLYSVFGNFVGMGLGVWRREFVKGFG